MWWCWDRSREPLVSHRPAPYRTIRRCIRLRRFGLQRSPIGAPERLHAMRHGRLRAGPQDPNHRHRRLLRARASGHPAAPPSRLTNSRRLMPGMGLPPRCRRRSYQRRTAVRRRSDASGACRGKGQPVLGADLNCSESRLFTPACGAPSTDVGVPWAPCRETQARLEFRVLAPG